VKKFIENNTDIKIAYNYHTFGNFFLIPYSYVRDPTNKLLEENSNNFYEIYKDFFKEENFPQFYRFGNAIDLLSYSSEGDASDWMLAEKGILSFSPELGNADFKSEKFYPDISTALQILRENFSSALFGIQKSSYSLKFNFIRTFNYKNNYNYEKTNFQNIDLDYLNNYKTVISLSENKNNKSVINQNNIQNNGIVNNLNFNYYYPNNYNNENLLYWAFCSDISTNINITSLLQNEYDMIYNENYVYDICYSYYYNLFYSISTIIQNEGLQGFFNEAKLKITMLSKGIKRIIGNFIKYNYSNSTITHFHDIIDSVINTKSNTTKITLDKISNFTQFEYTYTFYNYSLEENSTVLIDLKFFSENHVTEKNINEEIYIDLDIEFDYSLENKIFRKFKLVDVKQSDFSYFIQDKNLFANKIFDNNSNENFIVVKYNNEIIYRGKNILTMIGIIIPISLCLVISLVILLVIKKASFGKNKNPDKEKFNYNQDDKLSKIDLNLKESNQENNEYNIDDCYDNNEENMNKYKNMTIKKSIIDEIPTIKNDNNISDSHINYGNLLSNLNPFRNNKNKNNSLNKDNQSVKLEVYSIDDDNINFQKSRNHI